MKDLTIIMKIVSEKTGVSISDIAGESRKANIVTARHLSMWAYRWHSNLPLQKIAAMHSKRNHATVSWADSQVSFLMKQDPKFNELCKQIVTSIKQYK